MQTVVVEQILLDIFKEIQVEGNGIKRYDQLLYKIESQLSDIHIAVEEKRENSTHFEFDKRHSLSHIRGRDIHFIDKESDYHCLEDIHLSLTSNGCIKAVFEYEQHPSCYATLEFTFCAE